MTTRKSVSLSKGARGEILHSFFRDVSKEPHEAITRIENNAALDIYNIIYGSMRKEIGKVSNHMLCLYANIPLPMVTLKAKKADRKKGSIEPTMKERLQFATFAPYMSLDRTSVIHHVTELRLATTMPQYNAQQSVGRYAPDHISNLVKRGFLSKADAQEIEAVYVKACRAAKAIYLPIVDIVEGVIEILESVKSTKGLLDAWPECDKFLNLPKASGGELMKVNVVELNEALDGYYPPAKKSDTA